MERSALETHAAWVLVVAFAISLLYELWRATAKAGTSRHDSMRAFVTQGIAIYVAAVVAVGLLFAGVTGAEWIALVFTVVSILVSIFYYNPTIMSERRPGFVDWIEDLVFTGLLFAAAAMLIYEVADRALI